MRNSFAVYASQFLNQRTDGWDGDGNSNKDGNDEAGESRMFYSFATLDGEGEGEGSGWNGAGEELELELEGGSGWLAGQFQETTSMSLTEPLLPPQPQPQPQPQHQPRSMVNSMIGVICLWVWIGGVCMTYVFYFTLPNSIYLGYTQILFLFGWIMISATFSYAYMFFFLFRFTSIGVGTPLLLLLFGITSYIWSTSFSFLSLLLLIPLLILLLHRLSTLPLLFTNLKNQQNLLHLTKELSLHDIPLLFVLAPLGVVLGLIGSVPFGWVLWNLGAVHPVLGFGIGVVWVWSWGVLRGLLTVISAWVVGRWYNNNNNTKLLLPCLHASLPTITLSSLILSAIHILTFLINLLSLFSSFSSWFSLWSWFWFWFSPWSRFRSWTHLLVWCLHRITARFNPYTLVYIGFTGAHPNHSLSIPNRPINKVSSPLPLPLAFILAFALITYSSPYPSPQPTLSSFPLLLNLTLTSTLVSAFCTSLVNDIGDALWVSWLLDGEGHPGREEKRKRVREVFDYSSPDSRHSPNSRHSLPSPNSLDSPNSPNYANSEDPESISIPISVIVHGRQTQTPTQTPTQTQTRGSSRNINTMDMDPMDFTDTMMDDTDTDVTDTDMDETDLDPFVPGV